MQLDRGENSQNSSHIRFMQIRYTSTTWIFFGLFGNYLGDLIEIHFIEKKYNIIAICLTFT